MDNTGKTKTIVILLGIFSVMLLLNILMPIHRDDFDYSLIWNTPVHVASLQDAFSSCWNHYLLHGGRMVTVFGLVLFLWLGKLWFDIANALIFTGFVILLYMHAKRSTEFPKEPALLLSAGLLAWLCLPHFGEVAIWKSGSTVYLWSGFCVALFLLPYNLKAAGKKVCSCGLMIPLMLLLGILAGWSVENLAVTNLLLCAVCTLVYKFRNDMPGWMPAGVVGAFLGLIGLLAAPGNYVRYTQQGGHAGTFGTIMRHIGNQFSGNGDMLLFVLPAVLLALLCWHIIKADYLSHEGVALQPSGKLNNGHFLLLAFTAVTTLSYFTTGFVAHTLHDAIVNFIISPSGLAKPNTYLLFANVMDQFEQMAIYWFFIIFIYLSLRDKIGLTGDVLKSMKNKVPAMKIANEYDGVGYVFFLAALAIFNNFVMIAAPTFPGRASFGSASMIIIATLVLLGLPVVRQKLRLPEISRLLKGAALFLSAFTIISSVSILYTITQEHETRMTMIQQAADRGEKVAVLPPILLRDRALRHVFFIDFYNGVSKGGLCVYYGIKDIKIDPMPVWAR
ncbi:MAG: DUF6056 family protein [Selenomonadaceae bacterium]|nr:DUF6056 family protein [Selenomonadaceae bacterium]